MREQGKDGLVAELLLLQAALDEQTEQADSEDVHQSRNTPLLEPAWRRRLRLYEI
jgi:hypothetical protein